MPEKPSRLDFGELAKTFALIVRNATIKTAPPEKSDERTARIGRETDEARHARRMELLRFIFSWIGVAVIVAFCLCVAFSKEASQDDKKWATAVLSSAVTGWVSYQWGRAKLQ